MKHQVSTSSLIQLELTFELLKADRHKTKALIQLLPDVPLIVPVGSFIQKPSSRYI